MLAPPRKPFLLIDAPDIQRKPYHSLRGVGRHVEPCPVRRGIPVQGVKMPVATQGQYCVIFPEVQIGDESRIGNFVMIRSNTVIGKGCTIGSYVDIEGEVVIGSHVSLQSGVYVTRGVIIEDDVFCGPRVITMNDKRMVYRRPGVRHEGCAGPPAPTSRLGGARPSAC